MPADQWTGDRREPPSAPSTIRPSTDWEFRGGVWIRVQERLRDCLSDFRRIVGMPDYQEYLRHLRLVHPGWPIPSEREFFQLYLQTRYGNGLSRCC
jgi:uncharacterized short protein YbdD (DUF466 family)